MRVAPRIKNKLSEFIIAKKQVLCGNRRTSSHFLSKNFKNQRI